MLAEAKIVAVGQEVAGARVGASKLCIRKMMRSSNAASLTATGKIDPISKFGSIKLVRSFGTSIMLRLTIAIVTTAVATPGLAFAADDSISMATGKLPGIFSGTILTALICCALWLLARPLVRERDRDLKWVVILLTVLLVIKIFALRLFSGYSVDLGTWEAWALKVATMGPARTYQEGYFLDYPPGYLYWLWAAGALVNALGVASSEGLRVIVETPPLIGDFALSLAVFLFVRRTMSTRSAWIALALVALNPAFLFDSVVWGQTDSPLGLTLFLSVAMMLESEFEVGWALAALAILIKPQAFSLMPVIGVWTLLTLEPRKWWRSGLAFVAVIVIGAAPFQIGHSWDWLPNLYISGAAYYHETSVNAFNLMALIGGLREPDAGTLLGVSYFTIGMLSLVPLYAFIAWMLRRSPDRRTLLFGAFLGVFGFFMLATRMHERYFYVAVVFALPLAQTELPMLAAFILLTLSCLFNLVYILHTLKTVVFLDSRDTVAMAASVFNLIAFLGLIGYGGARIGTNLTTEAMVEEAEQKIKDAKRQIEEAQAKDLAGAAVRMQTVKTASALGRLGPQPIGLSCRWFKLSPSPGATFELFPWLQTDTIVIVLILAVAAVLRFWNLNHPNELVFDEVHFVGQARHYLHGETFLDPHPPLAKLITALGIKLFGDVPWAWRLGVATIGTLLTGVTYLLGRRMFRSRLAATLAASFVLSDGFFLVDSRIAVIDIVYLTFAAIAYLLMFRFIQNADWRDRRRTLVFLGISLGLCLGSKLYVPAIAFLLVLGFVVYTLARPERAPARATRTNARDQRIAGAVLMLGGISAIFYLACFIPHYYLGWWGGIGDLIHYYGDVMWYEKSVSTATHPYSSPWWSWPLMLRPVAYWQDFKDQGPVATIWGAGNPLLWWGVIPAMTITAVRAIERPNLTRVFIVIGYLANYVIWIPIGRILFLYHYMPSVYIGYLALGSVMADFWDGNCELWETLAVLLTILPVFVLGLGQIAVQFRPSFIPENLRSWIGLPFVLLLVFAWLPLSRRPKLSGRFVCFAFLTCAFALFIYYLPVWLGTPIERAGYYARMWFQGPGLRNWI